MKKSSILNPFPCILIVTLFFLGITTSSAQYQVLLNFNGTNGNEPNGSLTYNAGKLYGMTTYGGANDKGLIFSVDTNGNNYKDLLDFNVTNGAFPLGSLTLVGKKLYGMADSGGAFNYGCIFSLDTNGSNYKDLHDFNLTSGAFPYGSLTISGNIMFGMTAAGGLNDAGCIFSIDTNGNNYTDLFDFNGVNGSAPYGDLRLAGNKLYGMTFSGGEYEYGVIFSIDTNGNNYKLMLNFNDTNGANPWGSLILSGNKLYGRTYFGDIPLHDYGSVFSIDTNGNGFNQILNFTNYNDDDPPGGVTILGNKLYGMTALVAANIFSIDTNGGNYIDMYNFNVTDGVYPTGSLTFFGHSFYGMTAFGGTHDDGVIFKIDTNAVAGIDEVKGESEKVKVYPNPSNGVFNLAFSHPADIAGSQYEVKIYNVVGEKVYSQFLIPNSQFVIDLSNQPSGIYFVRVVGKSGDLIGEGKLEIQK